MKAKRVIVVGGGFGGLAVAKDLAKHGFHVTLIDKRNHHVFQPLLYQVATATLSPAQVAYPLRSVFRKYHNVTVLLGNVCTIDRAKKEVFIKGSQQTFGYDYLIVAAGARHSYFGHPEWEEVAFGLKTTRDALHIRERLLYSFEKAERTRYSEKRRRFSTVVVVGAGPTGVEMAGAIAEMTRKTLVSEFSRFDTRKARIILVEGSNAILNRYPEKLSKQAQKDLEALGVECRLNAIVTNVTKDGVYLGEDFIESENVIWAAGNVASPLIQSVTHHVNRMGQAEVNADFSIPEDPSVFCIGDCAFLKDAKGVVVPAVAQGALQAGHFVARQLIRDSEGNAREAFIYHNKGSMATIGRSRAVAQLPFIEFSGFFAWLMWGLVHVLFLIDFRNRFFVIVDWISSYFTHRRAVRLINMYREEDETLSVC
jgi:NADH dehydrogenase